MTSVSVCGGEHVALCLEPVAQRLEVLDDAVVDDGDLAAARCADARWLGVGAPCVAQRVCEMPTVPARCVDFGLRGEIGDARGGDEPRERGRRGRRRR